MKPGGLNVKSDIESLPRLLRRAIMVAQANDIYPEWPLGAIIAQGPNILASAYSKLHTAPALAENSPLILPRIADHAEEAALKRCASPQGSTIYVARMTKGGRVALARPCDRCQEALREAGVRRAVYSVSASEYGVLNLRSGAEKELDSLSDSC